MKKLTSGLILFTLTAHAGNFDCPMSNRGSELQALLADARSSLTNLKAQQAECRQGLQQAEGRGATVDGNLTTAITALSSPQIECPTAAGQAQQRYNQLVRTMETLRATDAPADDPMIASRPGNWKMFDSYLPSLPALQAYSQCVQQGQNNGLTKFYVDMTCVQTSDDLTVATASEGSSSGVSSYRGVPAACASGGTISPELTQAIQTAITTALSLTEQSNCPAAPRAAVSAMNLATSLAMSTPLSPLMGVVLSAGQQLFNGIFGRRLNTAEAALDRDTEETTETQAQCMYMNLQRAALGCNNSERNISRLQARVTEKNQRTEELAGEIAGYRSTYNSDPDTDYNNCTIQSSNTGSRENLGRLVAGWNLPAIEALFRAPPAAPSAPVVVMTAATPPVSTEFQPDINALITAAYSTCDKYEAERSVLNSLTAFASVKQRLDTICEKIRGTEIPTVDDFRTAFFEGPLALSVRMTGLMRTVPQSSVSPQQLLDQCLTALAMNENNARKTKLLRIRDLEGRLSTLANAERELTDARSAQAQESLTASGRRFWGSYHTAWQGRNGTNLKIGDLLQQRAETGTPINLRSACERDPSAVTQTANEVHAICLLNAGVYLHNNNAQPEFQSDSARDWARICSPFLSDPRLAPPRENVTYRDWQCAAIQNFEEYRANFLSEPGRIREVCRIFQRGDRSRTPSTATFAQ